MLSEYPIADMHVFPLIREAGRLRLLRESDHLLRRFGQLELMDLSAGEQTEFTLRAEADRFLFPINGSLEATLLDLRESSPSKNVSTEIKLNDVNPKGLLVPFGVACFLATTATARVIILSTHSESHPEDRSATSDELSQYTASQ